MGQSRIQSRKKPCWTLPNYSRSGNIFYHFLNTDDRGKKGCRALNDNSTTFDPDLQLTETD